MKRFLSQFFIVMMMLFPFAVLANGAGTSAERPTYVVKKGDTLSKIAINHHTTWPKLAQLNRMKNPDLIFPHQVLLLREQRVVNDNAIVRTQRSSVAKSGTAAVLKNGASALQTRNATRPCDPVSAITQLQFPESVQKDLIEKVEMGQYEDVIDQENFPSEHARKYIAYDTDHKYAFTYPDSCTWRKKSVEPQQVGKDALLKIPPLPSDRNENGQLLALPLGPTPGNVEQGNEELPKQRKAELIVLVRYLNHCVAENNCDTNEAQGELYMQRE